MWRYSSSSCYFQNRPTGDPRGPRGHRVGDPWPKAIESNPFSKVLIGNQFHVTIRIITTKIVFKYNLHLSKFADKFHCVAFVVANWHDWSCRFSRVDCGIFHPSVKLVCGIFRTSRYSVGACCSNCVNALVSDDKRIKTCARNRCWRIWLGLLFPSRRIPCCKHVFSLFASVY